MNFEARLRRWRRRGGCGRCWIRGRVGCFTSPVRSACRGTRLDNSWLRISAVRSPVWVRQCGRVRWRGIPGHPVLPTRLWTARSWQLCWANRCPRLPLGCAVGSRGDRLCSVPQRGTAYQPGVQPRVWVCGNERRSVGTPHRARVGGRSGDMRRSFRTHLIHQRSYPGLHPGLVCVAPLGQFRMRVTPPSRDKVGDDSLGLPQRGGTRPAMIHWGRSTKPG